MFACFSAHPNGRGRHSHLNVSTDALARTHARTHSLPVSRPLTLCVFRGLAFGRRRPDSCCRTHFGPLVPATPPVLFVPSPPPPFTRPVSLNSRQPHGNKAGDRKPSLHRHSAGWGQRCTKESGFPAACRSVSLSLRSREQTHTRAHTHIHTHNHTHIHIYLSVAVHLCIIHMHDTVNIIWLRVSLYA